MGKTVFAEESLQNILNECSQKQGYTPGLVIGQPSPKKDFAIHLVPTPNLKQSSADDGSIPLLGDIDEYALKFHLRNIIKSLPGGLYIIGIFIVGPTDIFNDKDGLQKVRSLVSIIHSSTKSNSFLYGDNPNENIVVLHFCSRTKRYQCKNCSILNMSLSMSPVTWKFVKNSFSWFKIECDYTMENISPYCYEKKGTFRKLMKDILTVFKKKLDNSLYFLNGHLGNNGNCNTLEDIRKSLVKRKGLEKKNMEESEVEQYEDLNNFKAMVVEYNTHYESKPQIVGRIEFDGVLCSSVFLHKSATIEEAVHAIKEDLLRSFAARLELHSDSLENDKEIDQNINHTPPRRVLVEHQPSRVMFSEYMFPDDTKEDIAASIKENLGIDVSPESIIDFEYPAENIQEAVDDKIYEVSKSKKGKNMQVVSKKKSDLVILCLISAFVVLTISVFVQFYM